MAETFNIKELTPEKYKDFLIYTLKTTRSYGGRKREAYRVAIVDANNGRKLEDFVPGGNEGVSDYYAPITKETVVVAMKKYIDDNFKNYSPEIFGVKENQIFYNSYGYDQTNYDFVQVIKVNPGAKTVVVRKIGKKEYAESGFMTNEVTPLKNNFIGEPKLFKVSAFRGKLTLQGEGTSWWNANEKEKFSETHYA